VKFIVALVLLGATLNATAQERLLVSDRPLDFALHLSNADIPIDDGTSVAATEVQRIGITWRERYGQHLQLGFLGGASYLTQRNNAATAGLELDGYHAGLSLDIDLYDDARANLQLSATYLYQRVDSDRPNQRVVIAWREPSARFTAGVALGGRLWASAGVRYGGIDGEQRLSGTVNQTRDVERRATTGSVAELELKLDDNGYVRLTAMSGMERSVALHFGRRY
jgi:hypothetical protein